MNNIPLIPFFSFCVPILSTVIGLVMLSGKKHPPQTPIDRSLRRVLAVYLATVAMNWVAGMVLVYTPGMLVHLQGLAYGALLVVQVFSYHYLYMLTRQPGERCFSRWHYVLPLLVCVLFTVWSLTLTPNDLSAGMRMGSYRFRGMPTWLWGDSRIETFQQAVYSKGLVRAVYSLVYALLSFRRIFRYRRSIGDFTADRDRTSLGWLLLYVALTFPLFLGPLMATLLSPYYTLATVWSILPAVAIFVQVPVLCYHTVRRWYVVMEDSTDDTPVLPSSLPRNLPDKEVFEEYIRTAKPYLKPDLKITDLMDALHTNRTYLSDFINRTYGVNFSGYINGLRLQELDKLLADPDERVRYSNMELILRAGFGSYDSYRRVKRERGRTILPPQSR